MTAAKFKPTSMQYIQSLGGDPFCIVSELPLFRIGERTTRHNVSYTTDVKDAIGALRGVNRELKADDVRDVCSFYAIKPADIRMQIRLQTGMIVLALHQVIATELSV